MRKIFMTVVCLALVLSFAESGIAVEDESGSVNKNNPLTKLSRGFCNLVTFILEVPAEMGKVNEESGPLKAGSFGLFAGIGKACIRMLAGAYEVATFPIPFPPGYKPVLSNPEYFYTDRTW
jgi:putative exosortase-associated protein (TIGR04073 family)